MKPLYWLFAWLLAAILGRAATNAARDWWRRRNEPTPEPYIESDDGIQPFDPRLLHLIDPKQGTRR